MVVETRSTAPLVCIAPAKINLYLRVVARRPDGFHELETVMAGLRDVYDTLTIEAIPSGELELRIEQACPPRLDGQTLPASGDNLVLKAARRLREVSADGTLPCGVRITLIKRVPAAAGLGGGSSDAATTLLALNHFWKLGQSQETLLAMAAQLGSDVPFFLANSPWVLCTGRGEILTPAASQQQLWLVVARPRTGLSTPAVFRACTPEPEAASAEVFLKAAENPQTSLMARALHNSLQQPAESLNPEIAALRRALDHEHVHVHQMTGSGSAYFAICSTRRHACQVAARLRAQGLAWVQVSTTRI